MGFFHDFCGRTWLVRASTLIIWPPLFWLSSTELDEHGVNPLIMVQKRGQADSDGVSPGPQPKTARLGTDTPARRDVSNANQSTNDGAKGHDTMGDSKSSISKAAKFNARTLKKLQAAIEKTPEVDLFTQFPPEYSSRLVDFQEDDRATAKETPGKPGWGLRFTKLTSVSPGEKDDPSERFGKDDIRSRLDASDPVDIVWPLSPAVLAVLERGSATAGPLPNGLFQRIFEIIESSEVL